MQQTLLKYSVAFSLGMTIPYSIKMRHTLEHLWTQPDSHKKSTLPAWLTANGTLVEVTDLFNSHQSSAPGANRCLVNDGLIKQVQGYNDLTIYVTQEEHAKLQSNQGISRFYATINTRARLQGHSGIVHGGATMALVEHLLNNLYSFAHQQRGLTIATQKSTFRKPIFCERDYVLEANVTSGQQITGRFLSEENALVFQMDMTLQPTSS